MTVKGGSFMEAVAEADTIVFDKTGTLTKAQPVVADVVTFEGRDREEMLRIAACLEEHCPHSMANAVVATSRERGLVLRGDALQGRLYRCSRNCLPYRRGTKS